MLQAFPALIVFVVVGILATLTVSLQQDRRRNMLTVIVAWLVLAPLLVVVNVYWPFAGGGDDENYFYLGTNFVRGWSDLANPALFSGHMEQPGFPWLLGLVSLLLNPGLLGLKFLNLLLLQLTALVWYRIGCELDTPKFGRAVIIAVLMLMPLWYYAFFLLKDLLVVLIQSIFLLGLLRTRREKPFLGWLLVAAAILAVLPVRTPLIAQNAAVATGAVLLHLRSVGLGRRWITLVFGLPLFAGLLFLASDPSFMGSIGVSSENRILDSESLLQMGQAHAESSTMQRLIFPALYVLAETSGLNPDSWVNFGPGSLRGVLALPWMTIVVPSFLMGLSWIIRGAGEVGPKARTSNSQRSYVGRMGWLSTPWAVLLIFALSNAAVSWVVGDTTRWRLSDMPVWVTIAVVPWVLGSKKHALRVTFLWTVLFGTLASGFHMWRLL